MEEGSRRVSQGDMATEGPGETQLALLTLQMEEESCEPRNVAASGRLRGPSEGSQLGNGDLSSTPQGTNSSKHLQKPEMDSSQSLQKRHSPVYTLVLAW